MKADYILQAGILDIIFENRNKSYGAYELRKNYPQRLIKSLVIVFITFSTVLLLANLMRNDTIISYPVDIDIFIPKIPTSAPEMPKAAPQSSPGNSSRSTSNIVLSDSADRIQNIDSTEYETGETFPGSGGSPGALVGIGTVPVDSPVAAIPAIPVPSVPQVLEVAEVMPSYPGGLKALTKFLERNLRQPDEINGSEDVSVKVKFIVGYDGKLKGFQVVEDGGELYNKEVLRVLKKMPDWIPGVAKGENVSVWYTIPVKFMSIEQ